MHQLNVFPMSLPDWYTPLTPRQASSEPHPGNVDDSEEWEVDPILDSNLRYQMVHCLFQWAGYSHVRTCWEPAANLDNTWELVDECHWEHPGKPRWDRTNWTTCCSFFSSKWIPVEYKWCRHGFYHLQIRVNWSWTFPVHHTRRKDALGFTNQWWDTFACLSPLCDSSACFSVLFVGMFAFILFLHEWDHAAQELCAQRGGWCISGGVVLVVRVAAVHVIGQVSTTSLRPRHGS